MIILALGFAFCTSETMEVIPFTMSDGLSLLMLLVPQWIMQIWGFFGISPFWTLHSTFCVRSPPIPNFKALSGLKYFDLTVWYLDNPFIIESPMSNISPALLLCDMCTNLWCSVYQPGFEFLPTGVAAIDV